MTDQRPRPQIPHHPSDIERMRVADLVAHTRAGLTDERCPVPACHHCAQEAQP